jgi:hypothetical protein
MARSAAILSSSARESVRQRSSLAAMASTAGEIGSVTVVDA